jgi:hypothetical protein
MCRNVERVEYRRGMLESGGRPDVLPVKTWTAAELPEDARRSIREERILELGGVYGDPDAGDPVEYDHLKLVIPEGVVEIEFFNRGITLFMTDDERFRRIHRVLCKLDRIIGS